MGPPSSSPSKSPPAPSRSASLARSMGSPSTARRHSASLERSLCSPASAPRLGGGDASPASCLLRHPAAVPNPRRRATIPSLDRRETRDRDRARITGDNLAVLPRMMPIRSSSQVIAGSTIVDAIPSVTCPSRPARVVFNGQRSFRGFLGTCTRPQVLHRQSRKQQVTPRQRARDHLSKN